MRTLDRYPRTARAAVKVLGYKSEHAIRYTDEVAFWADTEGQDRPRKGYVQAGYDRRWYPPTIGARVSCLDIIHHALKPFDPESGEIRDWIANIDRAITILRDDLHRAAPRSDIRQEPFRTWKRNRDKEAAADAAKRRADNPDPELSTARRRAIFALQRANEVIAECEAIIGKRAPLSAAA